MLMNTDIKANQYSITLEDYGIDEKLKPMNNNPHPMTTTEILVLLLYNYSLVTLCVHVIYFSVHTFTMFIILLKLYI